MNVLHLITGRGPTGPAAAALIDAKALDSVGHKAYIACADEPALLAACEAWQLAYIGGLRLGRGAERLVSLPHDVPRLRRVLRERAIDVVHVHRSDDQLLATFAIGRSGIARLVRTWHREPRTCPRLLCSKWLLRVNGCICVAREHQQRLAQSTDTPCRFVHPATDTQIFRPSAQRSPEILLAHVGRWKKDRHGRDRGQRAALDVFAKLKRQLAWTGLLVGRGENEAELRREAYERRNLSAERVRLLSVAKQSPAQFAQLLSTFTLGLVFETGSDGTSRAAVEMLACGVPLIVADRPGLRELAEGGEGAVRQLCDDPAGWAHAIEALLNDAPRLQAMRLAARQRAESLHALNVRGRELVEFYLGLS